MDWRDTHQADADSAHARLTAPTVGAVALGVGAVAMAVAGSRRGRGMKVD